MIYHLDCTIKCLLIIISLIHVNETSDGNDQSYDIMLRSELIHFFFYIVLTDDDVYDDETIDIENNDEEHFQIQSAENEKKYVLVNTRIDYQYRSDRLSNVCLYDFVSTFYKKKMNESDLKYLSNVAATTKGKSDQKGRPPNERFPFQKQHPQATTLFIDEIQRISCAGSLWSSNSSTRS